VRHARRRICSLGPFTNSFAKPLAVSRDGSRIYVLQSTEEPESGVIQVRTGAIR